MKQHSKKHAAACKPSDGLPPHGSGMQCGEYAGGNGILHEERIDAVLNALRDTNAGSVIDLGCGHGALLVRLVEEKSFKRIAGVDTSVEALAAAASRENLQEAVRQGTLSFICGSFTDPLWDRHQFDAAALLETIEHIEPSRLSRVELAVFGKGAPRAIIVTTPNADHNPLYGLPPGKFRHPDHRFEWSRAKFRRWAAGVANRNGYLVSHEGIGNEHATLGAPSQLAVFIRMPSPETETSTSFRRRPNPSGTRSMRSAMLGPEVDAGEVLSLKVESTRANTRDSMV